MYVHIHIYEMLMIDCLSESIWRELFMLKPTYISWMIL